LFILNLSFKISEVKDLKGYSVKCHRHIYERHPFFGLRFVGVQKRYCPSGESITNITWNLYGKMTSIEKMIEKDKGKDKVKDIQMYYYDASGNRVKKKDGNDKETFYVRDAQGNVMAVYEREKANKDLFVSSFYIYGSSRVVELAANVNMTQTTTISTTSFSRIRGEKRYEMSNHLSNVIVVVSDRKVVQTDRSTLADLVSTTDIMLLVWL
jgi:hypothetical protein